MKSQKWLNVVVIAVVIAVCIAVPVGRFVSRLANRQQMDNTAAIGVARRYLDAVNSHDQTAVYSFFSTRAKNRLAEGVWRDNAGKATISLENFTYELKTVGEVTCILPQKEWLNSPLIWVKISAPNDPNGLHILFIGENGEWKIVDMF